ncbi:hypothetical protein Athai_66030 [Actinocatenispora thailandica]|uniref:phosphoribosylaminoimidazolesuccinocarboxamide synthase n=1 Tax=Actinocatenispora thailandica TaxID=227318 RepID=A0A7R7DWC8_9ACTN|nr:hypothetical protein Athai_66030 [Actinocatenispora thailandica]
MPCHFLVAGSRQVSQRGATHRTDADERLRRGAAVCEPRGIILADTKVEWGGDADGALRLADEVPKPDSSRFWPAETWRPGRAQPSYDKQPLRDWLESSGWDKKAPGPELPDEVVAATRDRYVGGFERITGARSE